MMNRFFRLIVWLGVVLLSASCVEEPKAELRSITVDGDSFVIPVLGSTTFFFSVDDPDYAFDPDNDVVLYLTKGLFLESKEFRLTRVERDTEPGRYRAVITDMGVTDDYDTEVSLGIRLSSWEVKLSAPFRCLGEFAGPEGALRKTGLPILFLETEGHAAIRSKTDYVKAVLTLPEEGGSEISLPCNVRGRGNTTWGWPKKPYLVKFDKKASLMGMPSHKRWILLANFMDRTLMRNLVAMKVSSMTSLAWTPRCRSVELVLNGVHQGNYLLIEQVRVDKNRVNVGDDGFLFESDFHYDNEVQWMDPRGKCVQFGKGIPFGVKYPDSEDITADQIQAAKQLIAHSAETIYGPDFRDPEKGYASVIDVDSFIDYWIVFEVMGNHELGNPGSVYYHWAPGNKLTAGPCWDFDWGVLSYVANPQARTGLVNGKACWYARLFEDPAFQSKVKARYQELLPQLQTIPDYIDELEKQLSVSAELNFKLWNPAQDGMINGDERMEFHNAVARLKSIYQERLTIIQNNL